jgi:hypothetical protein
MAHRGWDRLYSLVLQPVENIDGYLYRLARRNAAFSLAIHTALLMGATALLILLGLLVAAGLSTSGGLGWGLLCLLTVGFVVYLVRLSLALKRGSDATRVCTMLQRRYPQLRGKLLSTVELSRSLESSPPLFSLTLFKALASETWQELRNIDPRQVYPLRSLRPALALCLLAIAAWAFAGATIPDDLQKGAYSLWAERSVEHRATKPIVGDLGLHYIYPAYMLRTPRNVRSSTGHIEAPPGTRVEITAEALLDIKRAVLVVQDKGGSATNKLAVTIGSHRKLKAELLIKADAVYYLEAEPPSGPPLRDPLDRRIDVQRDLLPRITLFGPENNFETTDDARIELGYTAEDDYGLSEISLVVQLGGSPATRTQLWQVGDDGNRRRQLGKTIWSLDSLHAPPGATIAYWLEAKDTNTIDGPRLGRSATRTLRIYSPRDDHKKTLAKHRRVLDLALRLLADRLLIFQKDPPLAAPLRFAKAQRVHRHQSRLADELHALQDQMKEDALIPPSTLRLLTTIHADISKSIRHEKKLIKVLVKPQHRTPLKDSQLASLVKHNDKATVLLEKTVLQLSDLLNELQIQGLMEHYRQLQATRKRIEELLKTYKKTKSEALRKEIAAEIARMQEQLRKLMAELSKLRSTIPDEYLNTDSIKNSNIASTLKELNKQLGSGNAESLENALKDLDKKLAQMESMLGGNLKSFRSERMAAQEQAYSKTLDQLKELEDAQRRLAEKSESMTKRYQNKAAQLMKKSISPFAEREIAKVKELQKQLHDMPHKRLAAYEREQLKRIQERAKGLESMLKSGDIAQALKMAKRANAGLKAIREDLNEELDGAHSFRRGSVRKLHTKMSQSQELAGEIQADIEGVFPSARSILDKAERDKLNSLGRKQRSLRKRGQRLAKEWQKGTKKDATPFAPDLKKKMDETARLMKKATRRLGALNPQQAQGAQQAAADKLAQLRKSMKQSRMPQKGGSGRDRNREPIRIPGSEAFKPPREFRQEIMDAMKEKPPAAYRSQIEKYYQELVR